MKYVVSFLVIFVCGVLQAQQPSISYLMCDEAKSQLQIRGAFGTDSGSVTIEDTTLGIVSWSDSLIICNLPDSGKGSGGNVVIENKGGKSNERFLSIIYLEVSAASEIQESNGRLTINGEWEWHLDWRADLGKRDKKINSTYLFEVSKLSFGTLGGFGHIPWMDSTERKDTGITVYGMINIDTQGIFLKTIYLSHGGYIKGHQKILKFDTLGSLSGSTDSTLDFSTGKTFYYYNGHILFPPYTKNIFAQKPQSADPVKIFSEDHSLIIHSENPLGETTASLYSIDGRFLKREKINIAAPGNYEFDAGGIRSQFGFLVLQTAKGVIARKVILQ